MESWPESDFKDSLYNIRELVIPKVKPKDPKKPNEEEVLQVQGPLATKMWDPGAR